MCDNEVPVNSNLLGPFVCSYSTQCYVQHSRCVCVSHRYALQHSRCVCAHDALLCATWPIHMCDMPHSYVWRDLFARATWPIYLRDMTEYMCDRIYSCVRHASFILATWPILICVTIHSFARHDSFTCAPCLIHTRCHILSVYVPHYSYTLKIILGVYSYENILGVHL